MMKKPTFVEENVETNVTLHEEETSQSVEDEELPDFLKIN